MHILLANSDAARPRRRSVLGNRVTAYAAALLLAVGAAAWFLGTQPESMGIVESGPAASGTVRGRIEGLPAGASEQGGDAGDTTQAAPDEAFVARVTPKAAAAGSAERAPPVVLARTGGEVKVSKLDGDTVTVRSAVAVTSSTPAKEVPAKEIREHGGDTPTVRLASNATPEVTAPAKLPAASNQAPDSAPNSVHDLAWLRAQDPSHYVIQLVGTRDKSAAARFLDKHRLGAEGTWFVTSHENKPWYVVVYGLYPDGAAARAAIKTLPRPLRDGAPWARSVASVVENAR